MTQPERTAPTDPLGVVERLAETLAHGIDVDDSLARILSVATDALGAGSGVIFLQDPDRVELELAAAVGIDGDALSTLRASAGRDDEPLLAAARERVPARLDAASGGAFATLTRSERVAIEPLVVTRGGIALALGVLAVGWPAGQTATPAEERLLRTIAPLASMAVDHGRLASLVAERSEWFERMAQSDPLTGLANQRTFARVLELELARAGRQGSELSLALFDVDGFVGTNERGGNDAGDDVLRAVAAVLNESVRLVDTVARIGGDEFVLVAPGSAGTTVARRVLAGVAALRPGDGEPVSVSAGVARFPADGTTAEALLDAAAAALAEAKSRGPATLQVASAAIPG